jgi:hypothetical protein
MNKHVAILLVLVTSAPAYAGDDKKDSLTVLPWSQAAVVFSAAEKVGAVEYSQLFGGSYLLDVKASAPIDDDTRVAAFTRNTQIAAGFTGSLQFGLDDRAKLLSELESRLVEASDAIGLLSSGAEAVTLEEDFVARNKIDAGADSIARFLCGAESCTPAVVARKICDRLGETACAADVRSVDQATERARSVRTQCDVLRGDAPSGQKDRCFLSSWWLRQQGLFAANARVQRLATDQRKLEEIWTIFKKLNPDKAKELVAKGRRQAILEDRELFIATLRSALRLRALERRDLLLTAMPSRAARAVSIDATLSYDRLSVFQDDLASRTTADTKYDLRLGANYTYYAAVPGLAISARAGLDRTLDPNASKAERCVQLPSTDQMVGGRRCNMSVLFRSGPAPSADSSVFARIAATYQYGGKPSDDDLIPGVEARLGLEGIFDKKSLDTRLTLFGTPVKGTTAARVGVALDVSYAINAEVGESRWTVTPLVFVGATFTDLFGSHL